MRQVAIATSKKVHRGRGVGTGVWKESQLDDITVLDVVAIVNEDTYNVLQDHEA